MTICIAIQSTEGIVIAADAEEGDEYLKLAQRKIASWTKFEKGVVPPKPELAVIFAGAGHSGYIEAFIDGAMHKLQSSEQQTDVREFLSKNVARFWREHVTPFGSTQNAPWIQMIFGTLHKQQIRIYESYFSTIREAHLFTAVGAGQQFANSLLNQMVGAEGILHTQILAAYIVAQTKERVKGCGKFTSIACLHNARIQEGAGGEPAQLVGLFGPTYVSHELIERWEHSFNKKWLPRQQQAISQLINEEVKETSKLLDSGMSGDQR
jgi:20S proteasome alpha/beta subunit